MTTLMNANKDLMNADIMDTKTTVSLKQRKAADMVLTAIAAVREEIAELDAKGDEMRAIEALERLTTLYSTLDLSFLKDCIWNRG